MTTRLRLVSALALVAGGGFVLTGVLLPAVTASRAWAQDQTPVAAPAAPAVYATAPVAANPPAPTAVQAAPAVPALPPTQPGPTALTNPSLPTPAYGGDPNHHQLLHQQFGRFGGPQAWQPIDPDQAAEVQQIAQEDAKFESEVRAAVSAYHGVEDQAERDRLRAQVSDLLAKQFNLRQKRRTVELESLEARVKKLREALSKRESASQTIIERRLAELLHDDDGLGWGDPGPAFGGARTGVDPFGFGPGVDVLQPATVRPARQPARARRVEF